MYETYLQKPSENDATANHQRPPSTTSGTTTHHQQRNRPRPTTTNNAAYGQPLTSNGCEPPTTAHIHRVPPTSTSDPLNSKQITHLHSSSIFIIPLIYSSPTHLNLSPNNVRIPVCLCCVYAGNLMRENGENIGAVCLCRESHA